MPNSPSRRAAFAGLAVVLAFLFQALTVRYNYGGEWSGLFCIGDRQPQPRELAKPYQFANSYGYDGQFYRLIAHDPLNRRGFSRYIDNPGYRYGRVLLPGMAWLAAGGNDRWIDATYIASNLLFVFLGAWWLALFGVRHQWPDWVAPLFLAVPAALVSVDRLTVDLAMAALCVGFVAVAPRSPVWYLILAAGPLCRETGYLLIGAALFLELRRRDWRGAALALLMVAPAAAWHGYVAMQMPQAVISYLSPIPLGGFALRLVHPFQYPFPFAITALATALDYVSLAGVALSLVCVWRMRGSLLEQPAIVLCALPVIFVGNPDVWSEAYAFGRTMSPLFLLVALAGAARRDWIALAPIAMIDLRAGLNLGSQILGIIKGLVP